MMADPGYKQRWLRKLNAYRNTGILPLSEGEGVNGTLLTTEELSGSGLDMLSIKRNINTILGVA